MRILNTVSGETKEWPSTSPVPSQWIDITGSDFEYPVATETPTFHVDVTRFNWEPWLILGIVFVIVAGVVKR